MVLKNGIFRVLSSIEKLLNPYGYCVGCDNVYFGTNNSEKLAATFSVEQILGNKFV
jgi:hypothetical protein